MTDEIQQVKQKQVVPKSALLTHLNSPGKLLHDAHMRLSTGFMETLKQAGYLLTIDSWAALNLLWEEDNLPQHEIGMRIERDRHQTSRLIDCLAGQGFVARTSVEGDRRVKRVVLTEAGHAAKPVLRSIAGDYLASAFAEVTQEDYEGFIRCLRHIVHTPKPANKAKVPLQSRCSGR